MTPLSSQNYISKRCSDEHQKLDDSQQIRVQFKMEPCSAKEVVEKIAIEDGAVDVYCWYEGTQGLPVSGAKFMKQEIFVPLFSQKSDVKLHLYSLKGWDFHKNLSGQKPSSPLGDAINIINNVFVECVFSSSFFKYCMKVDKESSFYKLINEELPKKKWLVELSEHKRNVGKKVEEFFNHQSSLFDSISDCDVSLAYSQMQYLEGYYLIRESVRKSIAQGTNDIKIAFVLPNDEGKYYLDYPENLEQMLIAEFGSDLNERKISISFNFFKYGESLEFRPYIDKQKKAPKVDPAEISSYFDFLPQKGRKKVPSELVVYWV